MREQKNKTHRRFWRKAAMSGVSLALVGAMLGVPAAEACVPWLPTWKGPVTLMPGPVIWEDSTVDEAFYKSMNGFAYKTACELLDGTGNENYSPVSLYYALALAGLGAEGETKAQLLGLLGVEDTDYLTRQAGNLYRSLSGGEEGGTLKLANSLWLAQGGGFRKSYLNDAKKLDAAAQEVDFADPHTGEIIGQWISDNTGGMLSGAVEVDPTTRAMLLNTAYFVGQWASSFMPEANTSGAFHTAKGDVQAEYMNKTEQGTFVQGDGWLRATLGLRNGAMTFVLPDEGVGVETLLASPEKLAEALNGGEEHYGEIYWQVPKFDFAAEMDLIPALQKLGVTDAFDGQANFSAMAEEALYIDSALQKTRIKIDENGVSAAAYTQMSMARMSLPAESAAMTLDRPFLYAVTAEDGTLLFVGVCGDPTV